MMIEIFLFTQLMAITIFLIAFYTHQEILWCVSLVLSGLLMATSYHIEYIVYIYDEVLMIYVPEAMSFSFPYLMGLNMLFFVLSMVLLFFDMFDKYSIKLPGNFK